MTVTTTTRLSKCSPTLRAPRLKQPYNRVAYQREPYGLRIPICLLIQVSIKSRWISARVIFFKLPGNYSRMLPMPGFCRQAIPRDTWRHLFPHKMSDYFYIGDTVLHPLHLEHPNWLPVFDILPDSAQASKRRLFDLAAATNCYLIGQHFPPFPSLGRFAKKDICWEWQSVDLSSWTI